MPDNLCAIFVPSSSERDNPIHLAARLIATRLAYPSNTRCILLTKPNDERDWSSFYYDFSGFFDVGERKLRDFIHEKGEMGRSQKVPENIHFEAVKKFDDAIRITRLARKLSRIEKMDSRVDSKVIPYGSELIYLKGMKYYARNRMSWNGSSISISNARKNNLKKSFSHFGELHLISSYNLDRGVPYPKGESDVGFIVPTKADIHDIDNEKLVHATAFCGLAIIESNDAEKFDMIIEKSKSISARYKSAISKNLLS